MNLNDIYNNNLKNITNDENYKSFNDFIFSNDTKILGKLLHRFDFFLKEYVSWFLLPECRP